MSASLPTPGSIPPLRPVNSLSSIPDSLQGKSSSSAPCSCSQSENRKPTLKKGRAFCGTSLADILKFQEESSSGTLLVNDCSPPLITQNYIKQLEGPSDKSLIDQADQHYAENRLKKARSLLLQVKDKPGWLLLRLQEINRQIRFESASASTKVKRTVPQRLQYNLEQAEKQRKEEKSKPFLLFTEELPPSLKVNELIVRPLHSEKKLFGKREIGIASCQGPVRSTMEDTHIADSFALQFGETEIVVELFGIFDGHGGDKTALFVSENISTFLKQSLIKHCVSEMTQEGIYNALRECFVLLDEKCVDYRDGSTAAVGMLIGNEIWIANSGDSRSVLSNNKIALQLSQDAKLDSERFVKKINKLGGEILNVNHTLRVEGYLNVGGSIGDRHILGREGDCCLPPEPQIVCMQIPEGESYLMIACDGYWDVTTTDTAIESLHQLAEAGESIDDIARRLVYSAISSGSTDNVSLIAVKL